MKGKVLVSRDAISGPAMQEGWETHCKINSYWHFEQNSSFLSPSPSTLFANGASWQVGSSSSDMTLTFSFSFFLKVELCHSWVTGRKCVMRSGNVSLTENSCASGVAACRICRSPHQTRSLSCTSVFLCLCSSYFVNDLLPHGNNTTCSATCCSISPAFLSAYKEVSSRSWFLFFFFLNSARATEAENHSTL